MFQQYIKFIRKIGSDPSLVQGGGGNFSIKERNKMYVKPSGVRFSDMNVRDFAIIDLKKFKNAFIKEIKSNGSREKHENETALLIKKIGQDARVASMETPMHAFLPKYAIHVHSIYCNVFLCMKNGKKWIDKIFGNFNKCFKPYVSPGYMLGKQIMQSGNAEIYFLQNHGIIIANENFNRLCKIFFRVIEMCKKFLGENIPNFIRFNKFSCERPFHFNKRKILFPDAAVYSKDMLKNVYAQEVFFAQCYIEEAIKKLGGAPRYIPVKSVKYLLDMKAEKYRKKLSL